MESGAPADRQCWNRPSNAARSASGVLQQRLEPVVHMVLDMAMKQRLPRLVGGKVHAHSAIRGSHHRVLDNARRCPSVDLRDLELMPMQVRSEERRVGKE